MKERQGNLVDDFKIIYDSDGQADHLICNYCGERVERGMVSCSEHGDTCKVNSLAITAQNNWEKAVLNICTMKCDHKNCTRQASTSNNLYFTGKWYCTFHANRATRKGRLERKYGHKTPKT